VALITQTQVIDASVDRVFNTVIDAGNYAAWNPTIAASRRLDEGELRNGSRFEWRLKGFGTVTQEFQEFERNVRVRIVPPIRWLSGATAFAFLQKAAVPGSITNSKWCPRHPAPSRSDDRADGTKEPPRDRRRAASLH
jgi:uncharacterized protein YndB with AHSA1/START domain